MKTGWPTTICVLFLLMILTFSGCSAPGGPGLKPPTKSESQVDALLKLGQERLDKAEYQGARDAYSAALQSATESKDKSRAHLGLARALAASGDYEAAEKALKDVPSTDLTPDAELDVQILRAGIEQKNGNAEAAATRLRSLMYKPPVVLSRDQARRTVELLDDALLELGRYEEAAQSLVSWGQKYGLNEPGVQKRLVVAAGNLPVDRAQALVSRTELPQLKAAAMLGLAAAYLQVGQLNQAKDIIAEVKAMPASADLGDEIGQLGQDVAQARLVDPRAVGVILPLSGPYAATGAQVLAAVEMGLGVFAPGSNITLYIEDSKGDPRTAAQAVEKLATQRRVMTIVGPLRSSAALAAARQAAVMSVPLVALSRVSGLSEAGPCVYQNFFTPQEQINALLREMADSRDKRLMAILAPNNSYGKGFVKLMEQSLIERGGSVVRTVYYNPDQTDFSYQIKELVALPDGEYRPGMPDSPAPVIDFEALFIPDGAARLGMLAPQLAYYDVIGVDLLGTSIWLNDALLKNAAKYLEGSYFPVAFNPYSKDPMVKRFVADYQSTMSREPDLLDAHGYDTALLVKSIIGKPNAPRTRAGFCEALNAIKGFKGVCGDMDVGSDGQVHKNLELFTVERERFIPLSEANLLTEKIEEVVEPPSETDNKPAEESTQTEQPSDTKKTTLRIKQLNPDNAPPAPAATIAH